MIVIGFDVSLVRTGVAVLEDGQLIGSEVIKTSVRSLRHVRLGHIVSEIVGIIMEYRPDVIAIETSAGWQRMSNDSRASIEALAQARAAVLIAIDQSGSNARVEEMGPHKVREIVCANPHASKAQVAENLIIRGYVLPRLANGKPNPDIADALAIAEAVWSIERLRAMEVEP